MTKLNRNTVLNIVTAVVVLGGLAGLIFIGSKQQKAATDSWKDAGSTNPSALVADESLFDFGAISMAAGNVNRAFTVKNSGEEPIAITRIYTSCMCTTATLLKGSEKWGPFGMPGHGGRAVLKTVAPGEAFDLVITFDPAAHGPAGVGPTTREVYIESANQLLLTLQIKANVIP